MVPEFILNKYGHFQGNRFHQATGISYRIQGKVHHKVRAFVVLPFLISGRGIKGKQDFIAGKPLPECFDDGPALFKLSK